MTNQLALVTGATSGIGEALSILLAGKGIDLILTGRNEKQLNFLKGRLQKSVSVETICADLSKEEGRKQLISAIYERAPDLVINNAGFGLYDDALTHSTQEQIEILQVNIIALLELSLEAARTLKTKGKEGVIVNVSSAAAFQVMPKMAVYSASKTFVNNFSEAFDNEMRPFGIRVLTCCPGMVDTHFRERAGGKETQEELGSMTAQFVAQEIWDQIQSKQVIRIINWKFRLMTLISNFIPQSWRMTLIRNNIAKRISRTFIPIDT